MRATLWRDIEALDAQVAEATQIDAKLQAWSLLRHLTRWLLIRPGGSLEIAANVDRYQPVVSALRDALPGVLTPTGKGDFEGNAEKWEGLGFGESLAQRLARTPVLRASLDMAEVAHNCDQPIERVAGVFFGLAEALDLEWLRSEIESLPVESRWHAQARGSLLDELNQQHRALAAQVLVWDTDLAGRRSGGGVVEQGRRPPEIHPHHAGGNTVAECGLSHCLGGRASSGPAGTGELSDARRRGTIMCLTAHDLFSRRCAHRHRRRRLRCARHGRWQAVCLKVPVLHGPRRAGLVCANMTGMKIAFVASSITEARQAMSRLAEELWQCRYRPGRGHRGPGG